MQGYTLKNSSVYIKKYFQLFEPHRLFDFEVELRPLTITSVIIFRIEL